MEHRGKSGAHPKAQLVYSFDIALQNEFSLEENIALARQFLSEQFVSRGMIVDFAVYDPDKEGGIPNPHFLCPIRPLKKKMEHGTRSSTGNMVLDENGQRVRDDAGHYVFSAVPTTDWGRPETLERWREEWAKLCTTLSDISKYKSIVPYARLPNEFYYRDTSRKIRVVQKTKGERGVPLTVNVPYGYVKSPEDRTKWLIDPEAAAVVKCNFEMCMEGRGPSQIANQLKADKVLTPTAYKERHGRKTPNTVSEDPYGWQDSTIVHILERREYTRLYGELQDLHPA